MYLKQNDSLYVLYSSAVWTSLAKMCVKTKRLDVAEICLGHMHDCRGLAILRSINKEELDVKVACLAVHLGMYVSVFFYLFSYMFLIYTFIRMKLRNYIDAVIDMIFSIDFIELEMK